MSPLRPGATVLDYLTGFVLMTLLLGLTLGHWGYALGSSVVFLGCHALYVRLRHTKGHTREDV